LHTLDILAQCHIIVEGSQSASLENLYPASYHLHNIKKEKQNIYEKNFHIHVKASSGYVTLLIQWAYVITLTVSASLHYFCITLMTSRQNICAAVQFHIYGVEKSARVCDKDQYPDQMQETQEAYHL
jgi:hypothetical protein